MAKEIDYAEGTPRFMAEQLRALAADVAEGKIASVVVGIVYTEVGKEDGKSDLGVMSCCLDDYVSDCRTIAAMEVAKAALMQEFVKKES